MKKVIFVFALALFATFSYASVISTNINTVVVEYTQEEPKTEKAEATESKSEKDSEASSTAKKSECSSKKKSSCSKSCGGK